MTGDWNTMEIGLMSPRFNSEGNKKRCATVTTIINGTHMYTHLGVPSGTGTRSGRDEKINLIDDDVYQSSDPNWKQSTGPIVLQEHDNRVQFRNIRINPGWLPATLTGWQRVYNSTTDECDDPT